MDYFLWVAIMANRDGTAVRRVCVVFAWLLLGVWDCMVCASF